MLGLWTESIVRWEGTMWTRGGAVSGVVWECWGVGSKCVGDGKGLHGKLGGM